MIDFLMVSTRTTKRGITEIYPKFIIRNPSEHLMIRGGDFYAIWVEEKGLWSTNEQDALEIIDRELDKFAKDNGQRFENGYKVLHMWDAESGMIDVWHKYCQRQMRDAFHMLDERLIFSNTKTTRTDYASKKLPYPLEEGKTDAWDRLMTVLYSPEERKKIEWAIGSIISGESKKLQKFMVLYGAAGTGKSTVLNVIQQLFEGYTCVFDAKALGMSSNSFALEAFKTNPLVAIQHDGDLSKIEDNTRLNSLVSHELMTVNEKFKSTYSNRFNCFLFIGSNNPVKISDAKSGLMRRLIDVSPTGDKLSFSEYKKIMKQIDFELGAIAEHCRREYLDHPDAYDNYIPLNMMSATNDFYNFVTDEKVWPVFFKNDSTTLTAAWAMYKTYCEDARVLYPYTRRPFQEELKNYFREYKLRATLDDGTRVRNYYTGFRADKFEEEALVEDEPEPLMVLREQPSIFDEVFADCPAQYANEAGTPVKRWANVTTKLRDLDTRKPHYVKIPTTVIVIDFDLKDANGEKSFAMNLAEASKWPATYAEVSKSGKAIHLHYIYNGDPSLLSAIYAKDIEVKVFTGNSSLRRKLTLCNNLPIATISHGLPMKEAKKTVNVEWIRTEKKLIDLIQRCMLDKEDPKRINPQGTKSSVDFIFKLLEEAYADENLSYDVTPMRNAILGFAAKSSNHPQYCVKLVGKMHFKSKDKEYAPSSGSLSGTTPNYFYDVEVFPNYFGINFKEAEDYTPDDFPTWKDYVYELIHNHKPIHRMINPSPEQVEEFIRLFGNSLIDFNGLRYDRHINYGRVMGYDQAATYSQSKRIIAGDRNAMFNEARNWGKTDVYDFASAGNKKSLKKLEIEMGFPHKEWDHPWDEPVPEEDWAKISSYCDNDVLATEAAFNYLRPDWEARVILTDISGLTVNDTTNTQTTRIIFGGDRTPQKQFHYRNLAEPVFELDPDILQFLKEAAPEMMAFEHGAQGSLLPYFPGYIFEKGVSTYRGEEVGEGGYVYAEPGVYGNVALLDIASMHPHSVIAECLFGPEYTARFKELVDGRVVIKHEDWDAVNKILGGKLAQHVEKIKNGELSSKDLSNALKTAINSVYGLTSASFINPFKDPRNVDNIVAKRGALFMIDLKHAVQEQGFTVAHIKTDSIKIPDATPEIIQFVMDFGKRYGYTFEHEATYDKMCLVNDAVYIAKYKDGKHAGEWTATGKQFQVPYVFKTLFSGENVKFEDLCETMSVSSALYLDMNEDLPEGEHAYHFIGKVGQFTPIRPGCGGGILLRQSGENKYAAATGSKGYRWMESEMVRRLGRENDIDMSFYERLANDAIDAISKYVDFEWFRSEDPYDVPPEGDSHDGV